MSANIVGSLIFAVPAIMIAWLALWRRYRPVFWSVLAMIVIATGYLNATGAARDLGVRYGGAVIEAR
jgi:uncharacterized membrane protein